jgi:hypothetical protein
MRFSEVCHKNFVIREFLSHKRSTGLGHYREVGTDAISDSVEADMGSEAGEALSFSRVDAAFPLDYQTGRFTPGLKTLPRFPSPF